MTRGSKRGYLGRTWLVMPLFLLVLAAGCGRSRLLTVPCPPPGPPGSEEYRQSRSCHLRELADSTPPTKPIQVRISFLRPESLRDVPALLRGDPSVTALYHQVGSFSGGMGFGQGSPLSEALDRLDAQLIKFRETAIGDLNKSLQTAPASYRQSLRQSLQEQQDQITQIRTRDYALNGADIYMSPADALSLAANPEVYLVDPLDSSNKTSEPIMTSR